MKLIKLTYFIIALASLIPPISSCSSSGSDRAAVVDLLGRTISFPDSTLFRIKDAPLNSIGHHYDYTIINVIDSADCTSCKMRLGFWKAVLNRLNSQRDISVNFIMVLNGTDSKEAEIALKRYDFNEPVIFDPERKFSEFNNLSREDKYSTLLLDSDNKIIAIGNPTQNPKIKRLYQSLIFDNRQDSILSYPDSIEPITKSLALGIIAAGDTIKAQIEIHNKSDHIYTLDSISCADAAIFSIYSDRIINPGEKKMIDISLCDNRAKGYFRHQIEISVEESKMPLHSIIYGFIQ